MIIAMETFQCGHPRSAENSAPNGKVGVICRECRNARKRRYYAADPGAELNRTRKYRPEPQGNANLRKTHCPQGHPYDEENTYVTPSGVRQCRTCRKAALKRDYDAHGDKRRAGMAAWREENAEQHRANARAWAQANPEQANLISRLKKHRRREAGVLTAADWRAVLDLYGEACLACGSDEPPTIDHVVPVSRGGTNTADNVQPLCSPCNTRKGTKTIDYRPVLAAV